MTEGLYKDRAARIGPANPLWNMENFREPQKLLAVEVSF
jgi:hypothetical protein